MATIRNRGTTETEELYHELADLKIRVECIREKFDALYGKGSVLAQQHDRHLGELADIIDWKLHILATSSPAGVTATGDAAESVVSVAETVPAKQDFSGGYLGG